jgi:TPP-dependent pyruvate/acetoin dehydrogenase alpha subunit
MAVPGTASAAATSATATPLAPPRKVRSGIGDLSAEFVEIYSDEDYRRATGLLSILTPDGKADPARVPPLSKAQLLALYQGMLRVRVIDDRLVNLQRQGRIGFYAEGRGQEASVIGSAAALESEDYLVPAHREIGAALYRGLPLRAFIAQVYGNANDIAQGRQMPVHLAAPKALRYIPMSSCVATQLPQATGIAWAAKILKKPTVVMGYLGEGATSAEDFHTGVNFAAVYRTPVVFICQNNQWAISTPASVQSASETFAVKALAYGLPGVRVDGNDIFAVYAAAREAVDRARRGEGPTLIETVTYRMGAHSTSDDPSRYRDETITEEWATKDPLARFRTWLLAQKVVTEADEATMRDQLDREVREAIAAEESVGPPPVESLIEHVFSKPTAVLREQLAELLRARARAKR